MSITITIDWPAGRVKEQLQRNSLKNSDSSISIQVPCIVLSVSYLTIVEKISKTSQAQIQRDRDRIRIFLKCADIWYRLWISYSYGWSRNICIAYLFSKPARDIVIESGKKIIAQNNYVLEGRDTGTIWAPDAQVKYISSLMPLHDSPPMARTQCKMRKHFWRRGA